MVLTPCLPFFLPFLLPFWGLLNPSLDRKEKELRALEAQRDAFPAIPAPEQETAVGMYMGGVFSPDASRWVQVDLGEVQQLEAVVVVPAYVASKWAYGFPVRYRVEASLTEDFAESETILNRSASDQPPPRGPVYIPVQALRVRYLRLIATRLAPHPQNVQRSIFCVGELMAFCNGRNVALRRAVTAPGSGESPPTWSLAHMVDGSTPFGLAMQSDGLKGRNGWHSAISKEQNTVKWVQVDLGGIFKLDEVRLVPARPSDFLERAGFGFPLRFRVEISTSADFQSGVVVFQTPKEDFTNPGGSVVGFPVTGVEGRYVRVTATKLWQRHQDFVFALAELEVVCGDQNVALNRRVEFLDETRTPAWCSEFLVDGRGSTGKLMDPQKWFEDMATRAGLEEEVEHLENSTAKERGLADRRGRVAFGGILLAAVGAAIAALFNVRRVRQREQRALREQIARDLHDEIGSSLASIVLMSERASRRGDVSALLEIGDLATGAAASMRSILWMLRGARVPTLGELRELLRANATQMLGGIDWTFKGSIEGGECRTELPLHRDIFLFYKEALHNVVRHSRAQRVWIFFGVEHRVLLLKVRDDGCGFDAAREFKSSGLANMRHRARQLGARLTVNSAAGRGTEVTLEVPL